ncbi:hypothetical protein [Microbacterium hydrocarbonoxydans]|uniref:hypothetical protein n=1 Tax=Microbacterium hydrocarbonoxydans TaxID=273678 RepID=UPI003D98CBAB
MHISPKLLPFLVIATLATPLAGCAVSITSDEKPAPSEHQSSSADASTGDSSADDDGQKVAPRDDEPTEPGPVEDDDVTREQLMAAATRTMRCDGELTILDDAVVVHVEGDCDRLILNSTGSQLVADDVALVEVIGDGNLLLTGAVEELLVNGTGNVVHWTGATPTVSDIGEANLLKAG